MEDKIEQIKKILEHYHQTRNGNPHNNDADAFSAKIAAIYSQEPQPEDSDLLLTDEKIWALVGYTYEEKLIKERSDSCNKSYIKCMWDGDRQIPDSELQLVKSIYIKLFPVIRVKTLKEVCGVYDKYIDLLNDELNELEAPAFGWGWKSTRYEQGIKCRQNISNLKSGIFPKE